MNPKLESIAKQAAADLLAFVKDGESSILEAWNACEQEAQENESKPKFKLAFVINLDLDADKMETALTWGVKHKLSKDASIPDPNQATFDEPFSTKAANEAVLTAAKKTGATVQFNSAL